MTDRRCRGPGFTPGPNSRWRAQPRQLSEKPRTRHSRGPERGQSRTLRNLARPPGWSPGSAAATARHHGQATNRPAHTARSTISTSRTWANPASTDGSQINGQATNNAMESLDRWVAANCASWTGDGDGKTRPADRFGQTVVVSLARTRTSPYSRFKKKEIGLQVMLPINAGTNEKMVFKATRPVADRRQGFLPRRPFERPLNPVLGDTSKGPNLVVGCESGKYFFFEHDRITTGSGIDDCDTVPMARSPNKWRAFFHRAIMLPNLDLVGRVHQHTLLAEGFADGVVILHHQPQFRTGESLADTHVERRDEKPRIRSGSRSPRSHGNCRPRSALSTASAMAVFRPP